MSTLIMLTKSPCHILKLKLTMLVTGHIQADTGHIINTYNHGQQFLITQHCFILHNETI